LWREAEETWKDAGGFANLLKIADEFFYNSLHRRLFGVESTWDAYIKILENNGLLDYARYFDSLPDAG
ncbi:MAG: hypothetical protein FWF03_03840, partial [Defluviitaleaceae bacterium]|nr:hypothetical protein [Defluviitaleaceae bacterium]